MLEFIELEVLEVVLVEDEVDGSEVGILTETSFEGCPSPNAFTALIT